MRLTGPKFDECDPASQIAALQCKVADLESQLQAAQGDRPVTVGRLKAEISEMIGATLSPGHKYANSISRSDLIAIRTVLSPRSALSLDHEQPKTNRSRRPSSANLAAIVS